MGVAWNVGGTPAFLTRSLSPSRSSSNSARSCSRTSSSMRSMSLKSIRFRGARSHSTCKHLTPVLGHQDVVFDPDPADPGDVRAGFDSKDHPRLEELVGQP